MNAIANINTLQATPAFIDRNLIQKFTAEDHKPLVDAITSAGYTVATRGHHAGSAHYYKVYVYKNSDIPTLKKNNNSDLASFTFLVRYRTSKFFWARAERDGMSEGLRSVIEELGI